MDGELRVCLMRGVVVWAKERRCVGTLTAACSYTTLKRGGFRYLVEQLDEIVPLHQIFYVEFGRQRRHAAHILPPPANHSVCVAPRAGHVWSARQQEALLHNLHKGRSVGGRAVTPS